MRLGRKCISEPNKRIKFGNNGYRAGRLSGEAKVSLHETNDILFVTFDQGIPHGRIRYSLTPAGCLVYVDLKDMEQFFKFVI
jgi:hypothetical protein